MPLERQVSPSSFNAARCFWQPALSKNQMTGQNANSLECFASASMGVCTRFLPSRVYDSRDLKLESYRVNEVCWAGISSKCCSIENAEFIYHPTSSFSSARLWTFLPPIFF